MTDSGVSDPQNCPHVRGGPGLYVGSRPVPVRAVEAQKVARLVIGPGVRSSN